MKLSRYLATRGLTDAAFGRRIGTSAETVRRYRNGRVPDPTVMRRIMAATAGAVTPNDFYARDHPDLGLETGQLAP